MPTTTYRTTRARAWRKLMVAAINAGLERDLFSLKAGDDRWPAAVSTDAGMHTSSRLCSTASAPHCAASMTSVTARLPFTLRCGQTGPPY